MAKTRIGLSGWSYAGWRGEFFPDGLPHRAELEYASRRFDTIEINGSFYALQKPESYRRWRRETPPGFVFAVKGSRFITHNKKLGDVTTALANFFASGVLALREKLGPVLWQLPENLELDVDRVGEFLERLPHTTEAAARLATGHDDRVRGRSWFDVRANHRLRHAIEVRNESFLTDEFVRLARGTGTAIVFSDAADWPYTEELTAGFVYLRLHGSRATYASRYTDDELGRWADRIRAWQRGDEPEDAVRITDRVPPRRKGRDVYAYFDNDRFAHAPRDALRLAHRLGTGPTHLEGGVGGA